MWSLCISPLLILAALSSLCGATSSARGPELSDQLLARDVFSELTKRMSPGATLVAYNASQLRTRWSSFDAPAPKYLANVVTEQDVATVVQYCTKHSIPFLAQNGGGGWATTFNLGSSGVIINLAGLDQFTLNAAKTQATIGGGARINETIAAAYAAGVLVETGNCNCVGTLGAILGGGFGNLMGLYGLGVDNVLSLNVVLANGSLTTVTQKSSPDLFFAMRGAGPNFGIVTSAVVNAYNVGASNSYAWNGGVIFTEDKLEAVVSYINGLYLKPEMAIFMYFTSEGPPTNAPVILVTPFLWQGSNATGHAAFSGLFDIGHVADTTAVIPYDVFNTGAESTCAPGARKPSYGAGFESMLPATWRKVWNLYAAFQSQPSAENSVVLLERYSLQKMRTFANSSSAFPNRGVEFNAVAIPWYTNASLDTAAQSFGSQARDLWRATDGYAANHTYVNFAHGDEPNSVVYGQSLPKLQTLKQQYDPKNVFNQWFNIE